MTRFGDWIGRSVVAAAAAWWLVSGGPSLANDDIWDTAASGSWQTDSKWADNTSPGLFDTATFSLAGAYTVSVDADPTPIRALTLTGAANVTFTSGSRTLRVNSSQSGGPQIVVIINGASLSLGTFVLGISKPLHLTVGADLLVQSGSTLNVRFGSDVVTSRLFGDGQINVSGSGSTLNGGFTDIDGGSVNVTAGGVVQTAFAIFNGVSLGTVSGAGSQWIDTGAIGVGDAGEGTLNITAGGKVQSSGGVIGNDPAAVGVVAVSGANSQWNNSSDLTVGSRGSGTLNVTGGGSVSSTHGIIGQSIGSDGTATITGGAWTMTGRLSIGGDLPFAGGQGALNIQPAGTVSAAQGVVIFPQGLVRLQEGTLDASAVSFQGGGLFQWTSGTLHVGTFNGDLFNPGGTLAPGHSAGSTTINGSYTQQSGGVLEIEIGGPLAGSEFDFVNVTNSAQIDGELDLTLTGGFVPTPAQTFAILISGGLSGAFDNAPSGQRVTTSDGGGSFLVNYGVGSPFNPNQVVLSNFLAGAGIPGDYNNNGIVDAADYVLWRNNLGSGTSLPNDDTSGVGPDDYTRWRTHFGQTAGSGAALPSAEPLSGAVPEPCSLALLTLAVPALLGRRQRPHRL